MINNTSKLGASLPYSAPETAERKYLNPAAAKTTSKIAQTDADKVNLSDQGKALAKAPAQDLGMKIMTINFIGFDSPFTAPDGADDLEWNVYRPDGVPVTGNAPPFLMESTGQPLTGSVAANARQQINKVTQDRINLYKEAKADGKSNAEIKGLLATYDAQLPGAYKAMVGNTDLTDPARRYDLGGPNHELYARQAAAAASV